MSAGTGIQHSEYNKHQNETVKFLQIWVFPNKRNVTPRYNQITLDKNDRHNKLQQILSPNPEDEGVWIHQDAWFHMGDFENGKTETYQIKKKGNGVYAFILKGKFTINNIDLDVRDGLGLTNTDTIEIISKSDDASILLMEVPMR
jgi:redox-sensitive bicupin YhaK (pirin superfamily)